ncbi:MAG: SURF1 family protein [Micrococcales bacterium]|nr:SURF1 family protein [Micrococcales bacterium]
MVRLWLTRRWIIGTIAAILFAVACFYLGRWQWSRYEDKQVKVTAIASNYDAPPVPLLTALPGASLSPQRQWTHVTLNGTYVQDADLFVRNRTQDATVGFQVLTPVRAEDGTTLLVDRGWVPNAPEAETIPPVDPPPTGSVALTGWLRTGEPSLGRDLPPPQLASISIDEARAQLPEVGTADVYLVLGSQSPPAVKGPHPLSLLPRPVEDLGPHQAYAIQWWITMPGGLVFVIWAIRREFLQTSPERPVPTKPAGPARPKKVRIWDEEDY